MKIKFQFNINIKKILAIIIILASYIGLFWIFPFVTYNPVIGSFSYLVVVGILHGTVLIVIGLGFLIYWAIDQLGIV
jgi:hypothetical protein